MPQLTPEQYLEIERKAEFRSEYYNGEMRSMESANRWHDRIYFELVLLLVPHSDERRYEPHSSNMRVCVEPGRFITYPDFSVTCEAPEFLDDQEDTLVNPTLRCEILSPGTEAYDRGRKARMYREMPSLRELLLITQEEPVVDLLRKKPDGSWTILSASGMDGAIELRSIEYTLHLGELYGAVARERMATCGAPGVA